MGTHPCCDASQQHLIARLTAADPGAWSGPLLAADVRRDDPGSRYRHHHKGTGGDGEEAQPCETHGAAPIRPLCRDAVQGDPSNGDKGSSREHRPDEPELAAHSEEQQEPCTKDKKRQPSLFSAPRQIGRSPGGSSNRRGDERRGQRRRDDPKRHIDLMLCQASGHALILPRLTDKSRQILVGHLATRSRHGHSRRADSARHLSAARSARRAPAGYPRG